MSTPYDFKPGGSLRLKGDKPKKKKKSSHASEDRELASRDVQRSSRTDGTSRRRSASPSRGAADADIEAEAAPTSSSTSGKGEAESGGLDGVKRQKTAAEEKWERIQEERRQDRARKMAKMTHKERVAEFNAALDRLSEHHDLPKIGPG